MAASSHSYHEPPGSLSTGTRNLHRALVSLQEELEAVDWYRQRADACSDEALQAILLHNMDEEIEHACMVLEWLRRTQPEFERHLKTYLFSSAPVTAIEAAEDGGPEQPPPEPPPPQPPAPRAVAPRSIGSLKKGE